MDARKARMKNPAVIIPEAMKPIQALYAAVGRSWRRRGWARCGTAAQSGWRHRWC